MKRFLKQSFQRRYSLPFLGVLERIFKSFSPAEKSVFGVFAVLLAVGAGSLLLKVNNLFMVEIPARGGSLTEGIIGTPRFVNPLLAISDPDHDLSALIYSGLLKATPEGTLIPDLAVKYSISADGLSYDFTIREGATFHDGTAITADDVIFTIQKAQEPALKSPRRANWEGVAIEKISAREIRLTLKQPYAPFLENATLGILPKHIWKDLNAEQFAFSPAHIDAVGSGPYRIEKVRKSEAGVPIYYELVPFEDYTLDAPYIARLVFRFYQNEKDLLDALLRGDIESVGSITPEGAGKLEENGRTIYRTPLPRVFAVFFNQNQAPLLAEKDVRVALNLATDKDALVHWSLKGYGVPIEEPVPPAQFAEERIATTTEVLIERANRLLEKAKWVMNEETGIRQRKNGKEIQNLSFSLVTSDVPELKMSAEQIVQMWRRIGVDVRVQIFESGNLNQNVIRPRKYDALLFGEVIGHDLDLFAFWHSSQRNDPGLNIALYTNAKTDKFLEEARHAIDAEKRAESNRKAIEEINRDTPAIFLYSPEFIYVMPKKVRAFSLGRLTIPGERFLGIESWYIATQRVWKIFAKKLPKDSIAKNYLE